MWFSVRLHVSYSSLWLRWWDNENRLLKIMTATVAGPPKPKAECRIYKFWAKNVVGHGGMSCHTTFRVFSSRFRKLSVKCRATRHSSEECRGARSSSASSGHRARISVWLSESRVARLIQLLLPLLRTLSPLWIFYFLQLSPWFLQFNPFLHN